MSDVSSIAVMITLGLIALGFLALAIFSIRNLASGKHSIGSVAAFGVPVVVFGISWLIAGGDISRTAVLTFMIMFVLALIALFATGFKSLFT